MVSRVVSRANDVSQLGLGRARLPHTCPLRRCQAGTGTTMRWPAKRRGSLRQRIPVLLLLFLAVLIHSVVGQTEGGEESDAAPGPTATAGATGQLTATEVNVLALVAGGGASTGEPAAAPQAAAEPLPAPTAPAVGTDGTATNSGYVWRGFAAAALSPNAPPSWMLMCVVVWWSSVLVPCTDTRRYARAVTPSTPGNGRPIRPCRRPLLRSRQTRRNATNNFKVITPLLLPPQCRASILSVSPTGAARRTGP